MNYVRFRARRRHGACYTSSDQPSTGEHDEQSSSRCKAWPPTSSAPRPHVEGATMSSISRVFPDPYALLSLHPEDLAHLFLPYFRNLPWQHRGGVLSCVSLAVQRYPANVRVPLIAALMSAWERLHHDGLLAASDRSVHPPIRIRYSSVTTSSVVTFDRLAVAASQRR